MSTASPSDAGFDGSFFSGVGNPSMLVRLLRGSITPSKFPQINFARQLLWYTPENEPPHLLWCNADGEWFDLTLTPIEKP